MAAWKARRVTREARPLIDRMRARLGGKRIEASRSPVPLEVTSPSLPPLASLPRLIRNQVTAMPPLTREIFQRGLDDVWAEGAKPVEPAPVPLGWRDLPVEMRAKIDHEIGSS